MHPSEKWQKRDLNSWSSDSKIYFGEELSGLRHMHIPVVGLWASIMAITWDVITTAELQAPLQTY